jgi:RHS repeat-associated protein
MKGYKKLFALALWAILCMNLAPAHSQTMSSSPSGSSGAHACSGGGTGTVSPCTADQVGSTEVATGAGNPINVMSGNKYQREDDLPALPGVLGLEIVRHYNSLHSGPGSPNGILGRGWRLSYETALHVTGRALQITQADGSRLIFSRDPFDPSRCATANPADGTIVISKTPRGNEYAWTWRNGRRLDFDSAGKLIQILAPTGEFITLDYNRRGWLHKVSDPQGRSLFLRYPDYAAARGKRFTGVMAIDSPVGQFRYAQGSVLPEGATVAPVQLLANLTKVNFPDGNARLYHYEDARHPTLLTGISDNDGRRISTYGYNANGLAVLSVKGEPARHVADKEGKPQLVEGTGIEQVRLDFSEPGQTTLTNSLGQKTVYRHAMIGGGLRLLDVRGAGCASCGEANVRYSYDRLGRLTATTQLNAEGKPVQTIERGLDYYGRIQELRRIAYRDGKPGKASWLVRYDYQDDRPQPTLIARPSVVPGKQYETRITYNAQGQPTGITDRGWSPAIEDGQAATPIERTTRYSYASINGRGLLSRIDGPLPNGLADSNVTQLRYDSRGNYLTEILHPDGNMTRISARDQAGRPSAYATDDGAALLHTQLNHAPQGQVRQVKQTAWLLKPTSTPPAQIDEVSKRGRTLDASFDGLGQLTALRLPALEQHFSIKPAMEVPKPGISDPAAPGAASTVAPQLRTGEPGSIAERSVLHIVSPASRPSEVEMSLARRWLDDFGRLVAVYYPGQGHARATYVGASGRIASLVDAAGVRTQWQYDAQGRTVAMTRTAAGGQVTERLEFRYAGSRLVERILHPDASQPGSRIAYVYDAFGRMVAEQQQQGKFTYTVHHAYDDGGRRIRTGISQQHGAGGEVHVPDIRLRYHADPKRGDRITAIDAGDNWFGVRNILSNLQWLVPPLPSLHHPRHVNPTARNVPWVATSWRYGNDLQAQAEYTATPSSEFAYRLRTYHDGVHPYAIDSDDDGHLNAVVQGETALKLAESRWHLLPQARAANEKQGTNRNLPVSGDPFKPPSAASYRVEDHIPRDSAGRRLVHQAAQGELDLAWDSAGQLAQVTRHGTPIATYRYDAQGRRIAKLMHGNPKANRHFIYSGRQLLAEADDKGDITRQFIYVGQRPVAWIEPAHGRLQGLRQALFGPKIIYLHTDHRGAVTAATDNERAILWRATPDVRGNVQEAATAQHQIEQPLRLVGQYADLETGLHYNLARYYEPRSGTFLSPDPAGLDAGSLDLYAYANGDPLNFFDPDGWAKITYYAITAGADGKTGLGKNQGFTKARWAFAITDIKDGGMSNVLYDPGGEFVKNRLNDEARKGDAFAWNHGEQDDIHNPLQLMQQYYGDNLINIRQFTIKNFDDAQARGILRKLGYVHPNGNSDCKEGILPEIFFAPEDAPINVTKSSANGANKQRILNCIRPTSLPVTYSSDVERRRIEKYEAAAELQESPASSAIYRDCSTNSGCRSNTDITVNGHSYYASYGRTQFVIETFLRAVISSVINNPNVSAAAKNQLGLSTQVILPNKDLGTMVDLIGLAKMRATAAANAYTDYRKKFGRGLSATEAASAWNSLTAQQQEAFVQNTGLGPTEFVDMLGYLPTGRARTEAEGQNAFGTEAALRLLDGENEMTFKKWLINIFSSQDNYNYISRVFLQKNTAAVLSGLSVSKRLINSESPGTSEYFTRQRAIEIELARRVAVMHNYGNLSSATAVPLRPPKYVQDYVDEFVGIAGRGDWLSLRCSEDLASRNGIEMKPLEFK